MQNNRLKLLQLMLLSLAISLGACSGKDSADKTQAGQAQAAQGADAKAKATRVTVTQVQRQPLEITQESVGTIEGLIDATIAAEVAAKVVKVHVYPGQTVKKGQLIATLDATDFALQRNEAQTEVARIEALLENQRKTVARNQALVNKKFISQNAVDNDTAQQNVLKEQLEGAKARVSSINHSSSKTMIYAPTDGVVEKKVVDTGEYVKVGDPLLQIISRQKLRAHLPFPEQIGAQLKPGLKVRLQSPLNDKQVESAIRELKPLIAEGNRSIDVIADVPDAALWQPGASVSGKVVLGEEAAALMVPEQSLVLRPAGEVVYVVRNKRAYQAIVKTGLRSNGMVEILAGLNNNDTIVVDGAGFLTDDTPVKVASAENQHAVNSSQEKSE